MLPSLTFRVRRLPARRLAVGTAGGVLLLASIGASVLASPQTTGDGPREKLLRDRLAPSTWALAVPLSWLEAPVPEVRRGDSVDLIAVRSGDRPLAIPLAADLLVMDVSALRRSDAVSSACSWSRSFDRPDEGPRRGLRRRGVAQQRGRSRHHRCRRVHGGSRAHRSTRRRCHRSSGAAAPRARPRRGDRRCATRRRCRPRHSRRAGRGHV